VQKFSDLGIGIYYNSSSSYEALSTPSFMSAPTGLDEGASIPNTPLLAGETTATPYTLVWSNIQKQRVKHEKTQIIPEFE
jgi:hypothetical protein